MITSSVQTNRNRRVVAATFLLGFACIALLPQSAPAAVSGPPVKVLSQVPLSSAFQNYPGAKAMALAMEKWINDKGGIGGRPLKVIVCDNKFLPTGTAACARKAVSQNVVATLSGLNNNPEQSYPIYNKKGIPVFLPVDIGGAQDYRNKSAYPGPGPIAGLMVANGLRAAQQRCKTPNLVITDAISAGLTPLIEAGYKSGDGQGTLASTVVPQTATDMSPYVGSATAKSDCILLGLFDLQNNQFLNAFAQTGKTQKLFGSLNEQSISATGGKNSPLNNRSFLTSFAPAPTNKAWAEYNSIVNKYVKDKKSINAAPYVARLVYMSYKSFHSVFKNSKDLTPAKVTAKLNSLNKLPSIWSSFPTPSGNWKKPFAVNGQAIAAFPRLPGMSVVYTTVKDGRLVDLDQKWHDVGGALVGLKIK